MKRALDVGLAALLLVVTAPVLLAAMAAIRLTSAGPALYLARRVGKDGRIFTMWKLRTMRAGPGPRITGAADPRTTPAGAFLRRTRIDEIPQLVNVLRGEMSLVGPRPEDPRFVELYSPEQRRVLSVAPGVTGAAQLAFAREEELLVGEDPEATYVREILPRKLAIDLEYVRTRSLGGDLAILARTARLALQRRDTGSGVRRNAT